MKLKDSKGITLVALSITIIVMMILATSISVNAGIFMERKKKTMIVNDIERITERVSQYYAENKKLPILNKYTNNDEWKTTTLENDGENYYVIDLNEIGGLKDLTLTFGVSGFKKIQKLETTTDVNDIKDIFIINERSHIIYYPKGVSYEEEMIYRLDIEISESVGNYSKIKTDGSWNEDEKVNTPKLKGTGLIAVYWDEDGKEKELTKDSNPTEWENWYDYNNNKWANAVTKDEKGNITGYFVWIPRFAYKITEGIYYENTGKIQIEFLQGTTNINSEGKEISKLYSDVNEESKQMYDFVVHPAFTDGKSNDFKNGEWNEEIEGFWIAKYPAGYQANTITQNSDNSLSLKISNDKDEIIYSNKSYTRVNEDYKSNPVQNELIENESKISYPVFKPLTYTYNNISAGDSYTISREVQNASKFYGLSNIDSHMLKNSEWGAVVYLTHSKYGRNANEININNYYTENVAPYKFALTGVYANGTNNQETNNIANVNSYKTDIGKKGSSTGNLYGVYDLNGCIWERAAAYINNENSSLLKYGESFVGTSSTKYSTIYPYKYEEDTGTNNYNKYSAMKSTKYGFGDAILEISNQNVDGGWNDDYSYYPCNDVPFFILGGSENGEEKSGIFAFGNAAGFSAYNRGFRIILISK